MRFPKALSAMVMAAVCWYALPAWGTGPTISFDYEVHDLGVVHQTGKVSVRFPFTNRGDSMLVVQGIDADCGCTETYSGSREVPPHGRSEIVAVLDTARLNPGKNQKHIHVRCNDPSRFSVTLTTVVEVVP